MFRILSILLVALSPVRATDTAAPTNLVNWATDWVTGSDSVHDIDKKKVRQIVEEAREHEIQARKELAAARADAKLAAEKADQATAQAAEGTGPTQEELQSAQEEEMHNKEIAAAAESEEKIHEARAVSAQQAEKNPQVDPEKREEAKRLAESEGAAALRAGQAASLFRAKTEAAQEKVRRMRLEAVLWAKWIGLVEHPGWYQGLDRTTANRHAIQEWLADKGQGGCKKPCGGSIGGYPLPPLDKGKPSLYCFSVARKGPEMDIMYMQQQIRSGIFGCDGFSVYSDSHVNIDGFQTKLIPSTYAGVSRDGYAANSQVFMKTWMAILTGSEWYKYDFIAKVDPDCVFFPSRLRGHVAKYVGQNVFFLNCGKYIPVTMYGALEVFSKSSLGAYLSQHASCEQRFPFGAWGEDKYMTNCLESLGSKPVVDFGNFLHDERCWGVDCGNKQTVAFHAFKQVDKWYNCWLLSENDGY